MGAVGIAELRDVLLSDDPYPRLAELRSQGSVQRVGDRQFAVLGYDAARRVLREPGFLSGPLSGVIASGLDPGGAAHEYVVNRINLIDPPRHTAVRAAVDRWFTPKRVRSLRGDVEAEAGALVHAIPEGVVDLVPALAHPLPSRVICRLLGADEPSAMADWGEDVAMLLTIGRTDEQTARGEAAAKAFASWVDNLETAELSTLDLPGPERRSLVMTLFAAGHHTTRDLFTNGMTALLRHRDQLMDAVADPHRAVEEFLRYDTPTQAVSRLAEHDVVLDGVEVPGGSLLLVALGAANRDHLRFERPDEFDVMRPATVQPLSFAPGPHHCLGAPLARLEVAAMLSAVLRRFPDISLAEPEAHVPRRPSAVFHGLTSLRVTTGTPRLQE